jgi:hypothetical protein
MLAPDDKVQAIQSFHNEIRKVAALSDGDEQQSVGRFKLCQIANMDQTLFHKQRYICRYRRQNCMDSWRSFGYGQASVQVTLFADGEARVKPLVIFKGHAEGFPSKREFDTILGVE